VAVIHRATLVPGKLELLAGWLPSRPWCADVEGLRQLGAYRFDDPAGEVGLEAFLLQAGNGPVLHVPVTYRAAALEGAADHLIGTTEHSVLGTRWVYDACGDPVWVTALATAALTGGSGADEVVVSEDGDQPRRPTASVVGSGLTGTEVPIVDLVTCADGPRSTVVRSDGLELTIVRAIDPGDGDVAGETLTGTWADGGPAVLAGVRLT
jgi:Maltokinase N-terminal cap domain